MIHIESTLKFIKRDSLTSKSVYLSIDERVVAALSVLM